MSSHHLQGKPSCPLCPHTARQFAAKLLSSSCGKCFYCLRGLTSRCEKCLLFGSEKLDGGQAEIVVVPEADGTLFPMPPELKPELAILMADIFPTGFWSNLGLPADQGTMQPQVP